MRVGYYDITGGRKWCEMGYDPILERQDLYQKDIIIFHISDLLRRSKPVSQRDIEIIENMYSKIRLEKKVDNGHTQLIFISAGIIEDQTEETIRNMYSLHDPIKIYIHKKPIEHEAKKEDLEVHFQPIICEWKKNGSLKNYDPNKNDEASSYNLAFRLLIQAYILCNTSEEELPEKLKCIKQMEIDKSLLNSEGYWSPVLENNQLCKILCENPDQDLKETILLFKDMTEWISIPEKYWVGYKQKWFSEI